MSRHRPPVAAHRTEMPPSSRRVCRVCELGFRGWGDLCPACAQAADTLPPEAPDTTEVDGPATDRQGGQESA